MQTGPLKKGLNHPYRSKCWAAQRRLCCLWRESHSETHFCVGTDDLTPTAIQNWILSALWGLIGGDRNDRKSNLATPSLELNYSVNGGWSTDTEANGWVLWFSAHVALIACSTENKSGTCKLLICGFTIYIKYLHLRLSNISPIFSLVHIKWDPTCETFPSF